MKEKQKTFELEPVQQLLPADAQQRVMDQLYQFMELEHLYESAIREVKTKLEILDSEFKTKYDHNPIHHLEDRVKSPQSILEKLNRKGIPFSCDNAKRELNDIAGVRVVCNYIDDIYTVADLLTAQDDVKLIKRKDYIQNPKPKRLPQSAPGYRDSGVPLRKKGACPRGGSDTHHRNELLGDPGARPQIQDRQRGVS